MGKSGKQFLQLRTAYVQNGDTESLRLTQDLLGVCANISRADRERLMGYLENKGKTIFLEPKVLLIQASRMPGLDGQKMSKSYGNTITVR